ncbi:hypothetical protein VCHE16_1820, partial [Vibrio paracholerae HE-16]
MPFKNPRRG